MPPCRLPSRTAPASGTLTRVSNPPVPPAPSAVSPALAQGPVLAHVVRCGVVESIHRGSAVVTRADGSIEAAWGDPTGLIFPRSASKPIQAAAMVAAGLDVAPHQLALVAASHSGEAFHLVTALEILHDAGLDEAHLRNTPDYPVDELAKDEWIRAGHVKTSLAQNCSGKHSGMLATTAANGWDLESYLDPQHPLQQAITAAVARLSGTEVAAIAVDGCGAPLHGIPLMGLAHAFGRIAAAPAGSPEARVADAIRAHPDYLGGTRRGVTTLIREAPADQRLIAKDGAESVYAVGLGDGRGVAVKIADGHMRAKPVVLAAILRQIGAGSEAGYAALEEAPVLGHGQPVGAIVAVGI